MNRKKAKSLRKMITGSSENLVVEKVRSQHTKEGYNLQAAHALGSFRRNLQNAKKQIIKGR